MDQLLLPAETVYIPIQNVQDAFRVIRQMNVRGAPLIATVALLGLCVDLEHKFDESESLEEYVKKSCDYLHESRPTAINLANEILKLKQFVGQLDKLESLVERKK